MEVVPPPKFAAAADESKKGSKGKGQGKEKERAKAVRAEGTSGKKKAVALMDSTRDEEEEEEEGSIDFGDEDTILPMETGFLDADEEEELSRPPAKKGKKQSADASVAKGDEDEEEDEEGEGEGDADKKADDKDIRFWEEGWKERYYVKKFHVTSLNDDFRSAVATAYFQGLSWVMQYYYQGCPSWRWFYAYHYAPFSSDFSTMGQSEVGGLGGSCVWVVRVPTSQTWFLSCSCRVY